MGNSNKVSILLPTYNGADYIQEAVRSILAQDYKNWELIVVDDCSTDTTPALLDTLASSDARIQVLHNKTNKKLPASLNIAFEHASGDYITWTSDDNLYASNALSTMVQALDTHPQVSLVFCDVMGIDQDGRQTKRISGAGPNAFLYFYNTVMACFMYRRQMQIDIGGYDENLFLVEDYDFWLRANRKHSIMHIKGVCPYYYRFHPNSLTSTRQHDIRVKACEILRRELRSPDLPLGKRLCAGVGLAYNKVRTLTS